MTEPDVSDETIASSLAKEMREKVKEMKKAGADVSGMDSILYTPLYPGEEIACDGQGSSDDIAFLAANWNVSYSYTISSHHKLIGPALVAGRKLVSGEVQRNISPLLAWQNHLNYLAAGALERHETDLGGLGERILRLEKTTNVDAINDLLAQQAALDARLIEISDKLEMILKASGETGGLYPGGKVDEKAFAEAFGGSEDNIKEIYSRFAGLFDGCASVLDLGCGRGYFLDLAHERSIGAYGIDLNDEAVRACNEKGRKAIKADALRHVSSLRDSSLDGVFIAHVIEQLSPKYLISLAGALKMKMKPGSYLVIATPNILNVCTSSCSFYLDPTHVTHIHPDYLEFLLTTNSFQVESKLFYQPTIPGDARLEKIDVDSAAGTAGRQSLEKLNRNIDRLNDLIFGNRDFAIVAKKQGGKI